MNLEIIFLISLVASLVLGFTTKINTGYYAMLFAFINGVFIYAMPVKKIAAMWPIYLFIMLFIVTTFYGFALSNGTLVKAAEKIIYKSRNRPAILPIILFFICMLFAGTGAGAPAAFASLSPLVMTVCAKSQISRLLAAILLCTGSTIGSQLPHSVGGIIVNQIAENTGYPGQGLQVTLNIFANAFVTMTVFFIISYFILKGYKTAKVSIEKPESFTHIQKKTLYIIGVVLSLIVIPAVAKGFFHDNALIITIASFCDVTVICALGIILCLYFKVGKEIDAIHKVPFSIIIMICSMGMLINIATAGGIIDSLSNFVNSNINSSFAPYIILVSASAMSFFSATLGVVIPTLALLIPSLVITTDISPILAFSLISVGGFYTGSSPFSTCGAMALTGIEDEEESNKLFKKLLLLPVVSCIYLVSCLYFGIIRVWI